MKKLSPDTPTPVSPSSEGISRIQLRLRIPIPPAFKNTKRSILDNRTGLQRTLTPKKIKKRMDQLENAITSALFSWSQTSAGVTPSECSKLLRTVLCGLCDDSLKEIPSGDWDTIYVPKSEEGLMIIIERLPHVTPEEAAALYSAKYAEVTGSKLG